MVNDSRLTSPGTVATLFHDHHGELVRLAVFMVFGVEYISPMCQRFTETLFFIAKQAAQP